VPFGDRRRVPAFAGTTGDLFRERTMPVKYPHPSDLEPIERASRDELTALQLQRLQWTLRHAYKNVPHYTAAFDAVGAHPDDVRSLADLARFPFTTKKDLRDHYPFGMFAVPREQIVRVHASSGTTGLAGFVWDRQTPKRKPSSNFSVTSKICSFAGSCSRCARRTTRQRLAQSSRTIRKWSCDYPIFPASLSTGRTRRPTSAESPPR
jgi:hypothetical protein